MNQRLTIDIECTPRLCGTDRISISCDTLGASDRIGDAPGVARAYMIGQLLQPAIRTLLAMSNTELAAEIAGAQKAGVLP
jgi:hypothetical protein